MAQPLLVPVQQRSFIREIIENHARERGYTLIDREFVREAREQFEGAAGGPG